MICTWFGKVRGRSPPWMEPSLKAKATIPLLISLLDHIIAYWYLLRGSANPTILSWYL